MRGDQVAWQASLDRASASLDNHFDGDSLRVRDAQATIGELASVKLTVDPPDVSEPWAILNRLRNDSELAVPVDAVPDEETTDE